MGGGIYFYSRGSDPYGTSTVEYIAWGAIAPCRVNRPEDYYILLGPTYFVMCLTFTHPLHYTPMQGLYYCYNLLHKAKKMHIRHTSTTNCITHCHIGMCTHITRAHTKHDCANTLVSLCDNME